MAAVDVIVTCERVLTPEGIGPASVLVSEGRILAVEPGTEVPELSEAGAMRVDAGDRVVMPGVIDTHVHVNEPGRTEWEGFRTATEAAAVGGVTTIVDMPLNSIPPTTTVEGLHAKVSAAEGACTVDYGLWGGVVPGNTQEIDGLVDEGVLGFKCFLIDSGVEEFPPVGEADLRDAMPVLARRGAILLAHAELPGPIEAAAAHGGARDARSYRDYVASRPPAAEVEAIELLIELAAEYRCHVHIVHLSTAEALESIARARDEGIPVTVETCPHYLIFSEEEMPDGATAFKCAPPMRDATNRDRLWEGLQRGTIGSVASDHSPCPPALKSLDRGDFAEAWGGIASLQLLLSAVWTFASERGHSLDEMAAWLCERPARLAGIASKKGRIARGFDADLIVWDPEAAYRVEPDDLRHRHPVTPYAGMQLRGTVHHTFVRGTLVVEDGHLTGRRPGRRVRRAA